MSQRKQYWTIKEGGNGKGRPRTLRICAMTPKGTPKHPEPDDRATDNEERPTVAMEGQRVTTVQLRESRYGIPTPISGDASTKAHYYPKGHRVSTCL